MEHGKAVGIYNYKVIEDGEIILQGIVKNLITKEGWSSIISNAISGSAPNYYFSIFSGTYTPVNTETAATYPTNAVEITSAYNETARPVCTMGNSSNVMASTASGTFTFNATTTVKGLAITTSSTKGGTSGKLISIANDTSGGVTVNAGAQLVVDWTCTFS